MVLLINPKTSKPTEINTDFFREPNSGLLYLAAVLDSNNINVEILDIEQFMGSSQDQRKKIIIKNCSSHQIIGITSLTNTFHNALNIASTIKNQFPEKFIIMGGAHVSFLYESILKTDFQNEKLIDFICIGEAEDNFLKLVELILSHNVNSSNFEILEQKINRIKGIAYINSKGNFVYTGEQRKIIDIENIPMPARYKLSPINYAYTVANIIVNRGCPNQCSFCSRQNLFKTTRIKSLDSLIAEIRDIKSSYTYEFINFYDNINLNKKFFQKFCNVLKSKEFNLPWGCELRVDNISYNDAGLLKEGGCKVIATGIESASEKVLQKNFKYQSPKKVKRGIEYLKKFDISIQAYFILGLPGETQKTFYKTINYIKNLPLNEEDTINYFIATPYPGSNLWENRNSFQIDIFEHDFSKYDCNHLIFETKDLKKELLQKMKKEAKEIERYFQ
jgi:radical SAM superfamily enzyme YgiQ (UPF0313 family)